MICTHALTQPVLSSVKWIEPDLRGKGRRETPQADKECSFFCGYVLTAHALNAHLTSLKMLLSYIFERHVDLVITVTGLVVNAFRPEVSVFKFDPFHCQIMYCSFYPPDFCSHRNVYLFKPSVFGQSRLWAWVTCVWHWLHYEILRCYLIVKETIMLLIHLSHDETARPVYLHKLYIDDISISVETPSEPKGKCRKTVWYWLLCGDWIQILALKDGLFPSVESQN